MGAEISIDILLIQPYPKDKSPAILNKTDHDTDYDTVYDTYAKDKSPAILFKVILFLRMSVIPLSVIINVRNMIVHYYLLSIVRIYLADLLRGCIIYLSQAIKCFATLPEGHNVLMLRLAIFSVWGIPCFGIVLLLRLSDQIIELSPDF